jgi:hypothetical protein
VSRSWTRHSFACVSTLKSSGTQAQSSGPSCLSSASCQASPQTTPSARGSGTVSVAAAFKLGSTGDASGRTISADRLHRTPTTALLPDRRPKHWRSPNAPTLAQFSLSEHTDQIVRSTVTNARKVAILFAQSGYFGKPTSVGSLVCLSSQAPETIFICSLAA